MVFERAGCRAIVAYDVGAGLRLLDEIEVDLVLLGYETKPRAAETFVRVARPRAGARLPILLWTTRPRAAERARTMGADGVFEKPTDLDALLARVRHELAAADPPSPPTAPVHRLAS